MDWQTCNRYVGKEFLEEAKWPTKIIYVYENFDSVYSKNEPGIRALLNRATEIHDEGRRVDYIIENMHRIQVQRQKKKGSRVLAIAYKWYQTKEKVHVLFQYSSFIDRTGKEQYEKKNLQKTARLRLEKQPRGLMMYLGPDEKTTIQNVRDRVIHEIRDIRKDTCYYNPNGYIL